MGTLLIDFNGTPFSQGKITDIIMQNTTKNAIIKVYGANTDIIQKMGLANRLFYLEGYVTSPTGVTFLNNALNNTGSLYYSSSAMGIEMIGATTQDFSPNDFDPNDFNTSGSAGYVPVYYIKLEWNDTGKHPMIRNFTLDLVESKQ